MPSSGRCRIADARGARPLRDRARRRADRPFRLDLRASDVHRRVAARSSRRAAGRAASSMAASSRPITGATMLREDRSLRLPSCAARARRRRVALIARSRRSRRSSEVARHRLPRRSAARSRPAGAGDPRPRRLPRRLGADRPSPLQLLGRQARRGRAVLARLPASVQLLRPARLLDALAPSRPGQVRAEIAGCTASTASSVINFADENPTVVDEGLAAPFSRR